MNSVYANRRDNQKQNYNQNMVKTYMLEGHINKVKSPSHDDFIEYFNDKKITSDYEIEFDETEDEFLFKLTFNGVEFFLDAENDKRFFLLHTSEKTEKSDKELKRLVKDIPNFDNIWLTRKIMEATSEYAIWKGISLSHDEINLKESNYETESFNLKINNSSQSKVKGLVKLLNMDDNFSYSTGVSHLRLMTKEADINTRVLDDLRFDGKISTRGKSFNRHLWLVKKIYDEYKTLTHNVEENYSINFKDSKLKGLPINIEFSRKDLSAEYIIKTIFSHKKPFNLWGFPKKLNQGYYKVLAVDLHNGNQGSKINFEVTKDFVTVYLPEGNCGNTIARLVCNIQQHLDSQIKVWGGKDDELF